MKILILTISLLFMLSSCNFDVVVKSGTELKGEGIIFQVPTENSGGSSGTGGISYTSKTVEAETDGKNLRVNGEDYGTLKAGDVVNLREKGKVLVNDVERKPVVDNP